MCDPRQVPASMTRFHHLRARHISQWQLRARTLSEGYIKVSACDCASASVYPALSLAPRCIMYTLPCMHVSVHICMFLCVRFPPSVVGWLQREGLFRPGGVYVPLWDQSSSLHCT